MKTLDVIAAVVLVISGLSWGVVAFVQIDPGTALGDVTVLSRAVHASMGLAAIYQALSWKAIQKRWALSWARY